MGSLIRWQFPSFSSPAVIPDLIGDPGSFSSAPPFMRVRLEQNPGFPIKNVGNDREGKTGMTEGDIGNCQRITEHIQE